MNKLTFKGKWNQLLFTGLVEYNNKDLNYCDDNIIYWVDESLMNIIEEAFTENKNDYTANPIFVPKDIILEFINDLIIAEEAYELMYSNR